MKNTNELKNLMMKGEKDMMEMMMYLYYGALVAATGITTALAFICYGLSVWVGIVVKDAAIVRQMTGRAYRQMVRGAREMKACYQIPVQEYMEYAGMTIRGMYWNMIANIREFKACYQIPVLEYVEYIRNEITAAWDFRNEILAADRA